MARVELIDTEHASPEVRQLFEKIGANGARVLNLYRVLAHSPNVMRNCLRLGNSLLGGTRLAPALRELAILRVAWLTRSEYESAQHYAIALETGVKQEQIDAIARWPDSSAFSEAERAVLRYTDEIAGNVNVEEGTFQAVRRYLDERSVVELTLAIGYWGMIARVLVPLQVQIDVQTAASAADVLGRKDRR